MQEFKKQPGESITNYLDRTIPQIFFVTKQMTDLINKLDIALSGEDLVSKKDLYSQAEKIINEIHKQTPSKGGGCSCEEIRTIIHNAVAGITPGKGKMVGPIPPPLPPPGFHSGNPSQQLKPFKIPKIAPKPEPKIEPKADPKVKPDEKTKPSPAPKPDDGKKKISPIPPIPPIKPME